MRKLLLSLLALSTSLSFAQTPCSGGFANGFPCDGYTLQSHLTIAQMGGQGYGGSNPAEAQDSWGWTDPLNGKEYAIIAMNDRTAFVDISDPNSPIFLGNLLSHTGTSWWRDLKVYNNHAYIVSDSNGKHGMQIFDLTRLRNVSNPPVTFSEDGWKTWGQGNSSGVAHNIVINEDTGFAYVVGTSGYANGGVVVFNLSNLTAPSEDAAISTYGYCHDAQVVVYNGPDTEHIGKEILVGSFSNADHVKVLDVTNKNNISQIGIVDYTNKRYTHQGWFTEDQKYFIVGDELDEGYYGFNTRTLVFDMTDLDNPILHHTYYGATPAIDHNGYVVGNRFYLANYRAGMRVMRVDELYNPTPDMNEVGYFDSHPGSNSAAYHGAWNVYPFFESGNIIISDLDEGLLIVKDPNFDNQAPNVVCQNTTIFLDAVSGTVTIDETDIDGGTTDNIGVTKWTLDGQTTFNCEDVGSTFNITLTAEDDYGNKDSCVATITIAAAPTTFNGTSWSDGIPGLGSNAIIDGAYNSNSETSIDACTCAVNNGATLRIEAGDYLKTEGDIDVSGNLIVEHEGSVVQIDPTASVNKLGSGSVNVNVTTPTLEQRDFMIMGSPMTAETRNGVYSSAFLVLEFVPQNFLPHPDVPAGGTNFADDNGDYYQVINTNATMNPGEGYVVRPQTGFGDPAGIPYDFSYAQGTLNNGTITYTAQNNGPTDNPDGTPNVVANPYPSAIDTDLFLAANTGVNAVYFWEHLTPPGAPLTGSNLRFDMDDISVYNGTMGLPAANDPGNTFGTSPNNVISTAQGFGIRTTGADGSTETISFTNTMRKTDGNSTLRELEVPTEKLLLEVRESEYGYGSFTGVAFHQEGSEGLDDGKDTNRLATVVSLYSHLEDGSQELGIQTLGQFESGTKIPLGFSSQIEEELAYEITIKDIIGENLSNTSVYLIDYLEDTVTILNDNPYTFISKEGTYHERFALVFEKNVVLGPEENELQGIVLFPNPTRNNLNIFSPYSNLKSLEVYDLLGKRLSENIEEERRGYSLNLSSLETGVYFVHITTEKGSITKKVVKN